MHPNNFNASTAKVLRDAAYPDRYVLEDAGGRLLLKRKSHCATHTSPRFWRSRDAAEAFLRSMRAKLVNAL